MRMYLPALAVVLVLAACTGSATENESGEGTTTPSPTANPIEATVVVTTIPCDTPTPCPECPEQAPCPTCPEPIVCPTCPTCPVCPGPIVCPEPIPCPTCPTCPIAPAQPQADCADALAGAMMLETMIGNCELFDRPCTYEREALAKNEAYLNTYCR